MDRGTRGLGRPRVSQSPLAARGVGRGGSTRRSRPPRRGGFGTPSAAPASDGVGDRAGAVTDGVGGSRGTANGAGALTRVGWIALVSRSMAPAATQFRAGSTASEGGGDPASRPTSHPPVTQPATVLVRWIGAARVLRQSSWLVLESCCLCRQSAPCHASRRATPQ